MFLSEFEQAVFEVNLLLFCTLRSFCKEAFTHRERWSYNNRRTPAILSVKSDDVFLSIPKYKIRLIFRLPDFERNT